MMDKRPVQPKRRRVLCMIGAAAASGTGLIPMPGQAQDGARAPLLRLVLPVPAGGAADATMRMLGDAMKARFGRNVIVDNRPGASGVIAMQTGMSAPPDGNTLTFVHVGMLGAQLLLKRFDVDRQSAPVTMTGEGWLALVTPAASPFRRFASVRDAAAAQPGKMTYGTIGIGSLEHITTEAMCRLAGIQATHVPYKGGPDVVQALLAGQIDFALLLTQVVLPYVERGQLHALVSHSPQPQKTLPGVPTFSDLGLPMRSIGFWGGLCAPAGTPAQVVTNLHRQITTVVQDPSFQQKIRALGSDPIVSASPDAFTRRIREDLNWMAGVIAQGHISVS